MGGFWNGWNARREANEVFWHDIVTERTYDEEMPSYFRKTKMKHYEYKVLPPEFNSPHFIVIYGDKVGNLLWNEPPFAFVVENKQVAKNYMDYFWFLWKRLLKPK